MKYIKKQSEPLSLKQFRAIPVANYDDYMEKDELRQALGEEQGFICCYCMQRIKLETMHIEHWKPRSLYPALSLDYKNLLAVCAGNAGNPQHLQHCDSRKGSSEIAIDPTNPNCETLVKFRSSGEVYSDNERIDRELNDVLNLNMQTLIINRKTVLDFAVQNLMAAKRDGTWSKAILKKELRKWENIDNDGKYESYCRIVIFFIEKKLLKAN